MWRLFKQKVEREFLVFDGVGLLDETQSEMRGSELRQQLSQQKEELTQKLAWLEKKLPALASDIDSAYKKLSELKAKYRPAFIKDKKQQLEIIIEQFEMEYSNHRREQAIAKAELWQLEQTVLESDNKTQ